MDLEIVNKNINVCDKAFDKKSEYPIDCEFTLPDYCPDVERILKCCINTNVTNFTVLTDTATVEIGAIINILYLDKNGKLFGYEMPLNLSKTIDTGTVPSRTFKSCYTKTEYVNCRAVNSRKIDVHSSVSVYAKLLSSKNIDTISSIDNDYVVLKKQKLEISQIQGFDGKIISINEDIDLASTNGSISNILRYKAVPCVESCKTISNKAIVTINVYVEVLYLSSDLQYEILRHTISVNQVLDVDGIDENSICNAIVNLSSLNIKSKVNEDDEMRSINALIKLDLSVVGYSNESVELVTDAYSTKYESKADKKELCFDKCIESISDSFTHKDNIEITSQITQIVDVKSEIDSYKCGIQDDKLEISGEINLCIVSLNEKGKCEYYEKKVEFLHSHKLIEANCNGICELSICITDCSYNIISSNCIDLRVEMKFNGIIQKEIKMQVLDSIYLDENKSKNFDDMPSVAVYFAKTGENIWDIALKYNTSVEEIVEANSINCEVLSENTMLLIPSM